MPFAIMKDEKTIDDLVRRLFSQDGKISKAAAMKAGSALLKANPQFKEMSRVPAGSLIVIPDIAHPVVPSQLVPAPVSAFSAAAERVQEALHSLAGRLESMDVRVRQAAQSLTERAKLEEPPHDVENLMDLSHILPLAGKATQVKMKEVESGLKVRAEAFASLQKHVGSFLKK